MKRTNKKQSSFAVKLRRTRPLVSVVMPMHNAAKYVKAAVESIQRQTYPKWELVVIDDASTDRSYGIVRRMARKDKRIKLYKNIKNLGIGATMNKLLQYARGDLIARMDADDVAFPDRLVKQVAYLQVHPKVGIMGGYMVEIDDRDRITSKRTVPLTHKEIARRMITTQTIQNPTLIMNRKLVPADQLWFDSELSPVDDLDFMFRQLRSVTFANTPEYLVAYRKHSSNESLKDIKGTFALTWAVRRKALREHGYTTAFGRYLTHWLQGLAVYFVPNRWLYSLFTFWSRGLGQKAAGQLSGLGLNLRRNFSVSLVMPVYKGGSHIRKDVLRLIELLRSEGRKFEVIVVIDGFVDRAFTVLDKLQESHTELKVLGYGENRGKGYAVRVGVAEAKGDYVGYIDAGSDIDLSSLHLLLNEVNDHPEVDAFLGDKRHGLSLTQGVPVVREFYSRGFQWLTNLLLRGQFSDTQVGLKLFRSEALKAVMNDLPVGINGFAFDVEITKELVNKNYVLRSFPIAIRKDVGESSVNVVSAVTMAVDLVRLGWYYFIDGLKEMVVQVQLMKRLRIAVLSVLSFPHSSINYFKKLSR